MYKYNWKCSRCGLCCENTISTLAGMKFGMFLLPHEKLMFPSNVVYPLAGVGLKGKARPRPEYVFAYQNVSRPCIYYDVDLHTCRIYDNRPLVCRVFPLEASVHGAILHRECPEVGKMLGEGEKVLASEIGGLEQEKVALRQMQAYYYAVFVINPERYNTSRLWVYNYTQHQWLPATRDLINKMLMKTEGETRV
jgi:Fe-S-cluster containining protein